MTTKTPPLDEFIDLGKRRTQSLLAHGYKAMKNRVTVAVYQTVAETQTLTIRISEDLAAKFNLIEGARMACLVHPDQQYIALTAGAGGQGATLFRPKGSRSLVYQTTLKGGTLEPQVAKAATVEEMDHALVISITQ